MAIERLQLKSTEPITLDDQLPIKRQEVENKTKLPPVPATSSHERTRAAGGKDEQPAIIAAAIDALGKGEALLIEGAEISAALRGLDRGGLLQLWKELRPLSDGVLKGGMPRGKEAAIAAIGEFLIARFAIEGAQRGINAVQIGATAGLFPHASLAQIFTVVDPALGALRYLGDGLERRQRLEAEGIRTIAIRHGKTDANAKADTGSPVLCGQIEATLTDEGIAQAKACAEKLYAQLGGDEWLARAANDLTLLPVLYSSPLSRARETGGALVDLIHQRAAELEADGTLDKGAAQKITQELVIQIDPRLLEMSYGDLELKTLDKFRTDYPALANSWDAYQGLGVDFLNRFPGGESRCDVVLRVNGLVDEIAENYPGRTVLFYCHLETVGALKTALGHTEEVEGRLYVDAKAIANAVPHLLSGNWS